MNIKIFLIIGFSALYGLFEIYMSRRQKEKREISKSGDKGSIWLLTISISLGYWLSFILMMIPVLIGYLNRIRVEEKFMVEQMGQKYLDYRKRTRKLIPFIY